MTDETTPDGATVAAQDIARLADVGRAAVSNWRRRFPDFPEPVGGSSASPLYSLAEVEGWLTRHGKQFQLTPGDRVWQQIRGTVADLRLGDLVGYLGAFLVFLRREPRSWRTLADASDSVLAERLTAAIANAVPELPDGLADRLEDTWAAIIRMVNEIAEKQGHASLFEFLFDRYLQVHSRRFSGATPTHLAELMVDLADVADGTVVDPACGIGTLLLTAHARGARTLCGQEIDGASARLAVVRLLLQDTAARIVVDDSLRRDGFPHDQFDVAISNLPFSERSWGYDDLTSDSRWAYGLPPRAEPELAWLQHCLAHVKPGGRVVVAMPAGVASRRAGRRIRANLLRTGALRAVISLAGASPASAAPDLWVLSRPTDRNSASHLLMVDASVDPSIVEPAWRAFLANPESNVDVGARSMRILDLLDDEVDISPARHIAGSRAEVAAERFHPVRAQLAVSTRALAERLPDLVAAPERRPLIMTTVAELIRAGAVTLHQSVQASGADDGDLPMLTVEDLRLGSAPSGSVAVESNPVIIEAGDVIMSLDARYPVVRVAASGAALGPRMTLLRTDPDRVDPHFLAGFLQAAQGQGTARGQSLTGRTDVRRISVPRLPVTEQRAYAEAFRQLVEFSDGLRETASQGEVMVRLGITGLADGSLQPGHS